MSDYTQTTDFSAKDALLTGDPEKLILGADFDVEFAAIASAVASKFDTADEASAAEAQAGTASDKVITPRRIESWASQNLGLVKDLSDISSDPGVDSIVFYDKTDDSLKFLSTGTGLTITGTTIAADTALVAEATLTAAQLADLHNTPVAIVPALAAGTIIVPTTIVAVIQANGGTLPPAYKSTGLVYSGTSYNFGLHYQPIQLPQGGADSISIVAGPNWLVTDNYAPLATALGVGADLTIKPGDVYAVPGAIVTTSTGAAGTGYAIGDEIYIGDAVLTVASIGGSGEVATYSLTDAGTNNVLGNAQATTTNGSGVGFTLDIDSLDYSVNPMTLSVKVLYSIFDLN